MANRKLRIGCVLIMGGALNNCGGVAESGSHGDGQTGVPGVPSMTTGGVFMGTMPNPMGTCCPGGGAGPYVGIGGAPGTTIGGSSGGGTGPYVGVPGGGAGPYVGVPIQGAGAGPYQGGQGGEPVGGEGGAPTDTAGGAGGARG
jgi:hypothetical protein